MSSIQSMSEMISVESAAEIIGCTKRRVTQLLTKGELRGKKLSPRCWIVSRPSAVRYSRLEQTVGRPRLGATA